MVAFAAFDSSTHAGAVYIALFYLLTISTFVAITRVHYRWHIFNNDDTLFASSYCFLLAYIGTILVGLAKGLAARHDAGSHDIALTSKMVLATQCLYLVILGFLKLSTAYLIRRLCPPGYARMIFCMNLVMVFIAVGTVSVMLAIRIRCSPITYTINPSSSCAYQGIRWGAVAAFDVFSESLLVAAAIALVIPLQMKRWTKFNCLLPFASRLIIGVLGCLHTMQLLKWTRSSEPQLWIDRVLMAEMIEIALSVLLATIPILKSFVKSFDTGFGLQAGLYTSTGGSYRLDGTKSNGEIELTSLSRAQHHRSHTGGSHNAAQQHDLQSNQYKVKIQRTLRDSRRMSLDSGNSREIMVKTVVHVDN